MRVRGSVQEAEQVRRREYLAEIKRIAEQKVTEGMEEILCEQLRRAQKGLTHE